MSMNLIELFLYGLMPMGQILMRILKFNGSLDKPYLLFPLLLIPPFSFIPAIFGYLGWIKPSKSTTPPIDIYVLIPIIARFIFIIFVNQIANFSSFMLQVGVVFGALLITNLIRQFTSRECKTTNLFGKVIKGSFDSMIQYAFGVMTTFLIMFIPFIGQILGLVMNLSIPYISQIIESLIWGLGLAGGYLLVNMYDSNFVSNTDYCEGKIGGTRMIISGIVMAGALFYQFKNLIL